MKCPLCQRDHKLAPCPPPLTPTQISRLVYVTVRDQQDAKIVHLMTTPVRKPRGL